MPHTDDFDQLLLHAKHSGDRYVRALSIVWQLLIISLPIDFVLLWNRQLLPEATTTSPSATQACILLCAVIAIAGYGREWYLRISIFRAYSPSRQIDHLSTALLVLIGLGSLIGVAHIGYLFAQGRTTQGVTALVFYGAAGWSLAQSWRSYGSKPHPRYNDPHLYEWVWRVSFAATLIPLLAARGLSLFGIISVGLLKYPLHYGAMYTLGALVMIMTLAPTPHCFSPTGINSLVRGSQMSSAPPATVSHPAHGDGASYPPEYR